MHITPARVREERNWVVDRADRVVPSSTTFATTSARSFGTDVDAVTTDRYREEVDAVFADGDLAVNVAALVAILRDLDVENDYPGFVVDELLGRNWPRRSPATSHCGRSARRPSTIPISRSTAMRAKTPVSTTSEAALAAGFFRSDSRAGTGPNVRVRSRSIAELPGR